MGKFFENSTLGPCPRFESSHRLHRSTVESSGKMGSEDHTETVPAGDFHQFDEHSARTHCALVGSAEASLAGEDIQW